MPISQSIINEDVLMLRRFYKSFLGETAEYRESNPIEPAILDEMVSRLREGDRTVIQPIILGHLKLVTSIVAQNCRSRRRVPDIEGAAFLQLVQSVNDCCPHVDREGRFHESRLHDNNITAYVTCMVKYAIKEEYSNNHIVRVPPRTIRYKIAEGEKFEDLIVNCTTGQATEQPDDYIMPFFIPLSRPEFPTLEFREALHKSIENETERAIVKFRSEGYTYEETGRSVGLGTARVSQIVPEIEKRFDRLYK